MTKRSFSSSDGGLPWKTSSTSRMTKVSRKYSRPFDFSRRGNSGSSSTSTTHSDVGVHGRLTNRVASSPNASMLRMTSASVIGLSIPRAAATPQLSTSERMRLSRAAITRFPAWPACNSCSSAGREASTHVDDPDLVAALPQRHLRRLARVLRRAEVALDEHREHVRARVVARRSVVLVADQQHALAGRIGAARDELDEVVAEDALGRRERAVLE